MASTSGLNCKNKTVTCDESSDYALKYFEEIQWRGVPSITPRESPWIRPEREGSDWDSLSFAAKYMNYETESRFIDLNNPFIVQEFNEVRPKEKIEPNKKKKKTSDTSLEIESEGVISVVSSNKDEDEEDFLDDYGNVKEPSQTDGMDTSITEAKRMPKDFKKSKPMNVSVKPNSLVDFPRKSFLNATEQRQNLPLYIKFWKLGHFFPSPNTTMKERREFELFSSYVDTIKSEQIEYLEFVKDLWYDSDPRKSFFLPQDLRNFLNCYFEKACKDNVNRLSKIYEDTKAFVRITPLNPEQEFEFLLERNLLELGIIPKIILPSSASILKNIKITTGSDKLRKAYQLDEDGSRLPPLCKDPNVDSIAREYLPDIVISSNPLKTIFNNFGPCYNRCWEIPILVKKINSKTVVIFDKTLLVPAPLSALEKTAIFIKLSGKSFLKHPWTESHKRDESSFLEDDPFGDVDHTLNESFGAEISQLDGGNDDFSANENTKPHPESKMTVPQITKTSSSFSNDTLKNVDVSLENVTKRSETNESYTNCSEFDSTLNVSNILEAQKATLGNFDECKKPCVTNMLPRFKGDPIDRSEVGDLKGFVYPKRGNVTYKLWNLRKKRERSSYSASQKPKDEDDIKVLIRCSIHGIKLLPRSRKNKPPEIITISSKLENQWNFGAETTTRSERAKAWISTYIRPGSINCRIRAQSNFEVCTCEIKSLSELTRDSAGMDFVPARILGNLYEVFYGVRKTITEEGNYLLVHDTNSGPFVKVFRASFSEGPKKDGCLSTLDLEPRLNAESYAEDKTMPYKGIPWIPIDFNIVTDKQKRMGRIPGLFCPAEGSLKSKPKRKFKKRPKIST